MTNYVRATSYVLAEPQIPITIGDIVRFNGFTFNDKLVLERARLKSIDGLFDSEFRDARADLPSDDGDVAYEAHDGGRPVVFNGFLEAGSQDSLTALKLALAAATNDKLEHPMVWNRYDQIDTIDSQATFDVAWTKLQAVSDIAASAGYITKSVQDALTAIAYRSRYQFYDARATIKVIAPSASVTSANVFVHNAQRMLLPTPDPGKHVSGALGFLTGSFVGQLYAESGDGAANSSTALPGASFPWSTGQALWLRFTAIGNQIKSEVFAVDPFVNPTVAPLASGIVDLLGAQAAATGDGIKGYTGVMISGNSPQAASVRVDEYRMEAYWPCDVMLRAVRKSSSLNGIEQQEDAKISRAFQLSMKASDPRLLSVPEFVSSITVSATNVLGRVFDATYDISYGSYLDVPGAPVVTNQLITVFNRGIFWSQPRIRLYGYLRNPTLINSANGQTLRIAGDVSDGDYLEIDFANHTIVDSLGNAKGTSVDPSSDVFRIEPGLNVIQVGADAFGGVQANAAKVLLYFRHAWK